MVNYRRVCEVVFILTALSTASAAPASDEHRVVYDQRQNGTENYRLNIDGVVIAVAPAESFLSALSDIDFSDLIDLESLEQELRPKPPPSVDQSKPDDKPVLDSKPEGKPEEKPELKPQDEKPDAPSKLDDVSVEPSVNLKSQKKSAQLKRQETTQRLKHRIASIFLPFLRKRRHQ